MLTDARLRQARPGEKPYKLTDERGLYLHVMPSGSRLWRFQYRFQGRRKLLAFGRYPEVSLSEARQRRDEARRLLAQGIDPGVKRKAEKQARQETFGAVALEWFGRMSGSWAESHAKKTESRLFRWLLPYLKDTHIRQVTAPMILQCARRAEEAGRLETAHRVIQLAGQVIRYAMATGLAESDPTPSLRGALTKSPERHYPAPVDPEALAEVLRAIWSYEGSPVVKAALQILALTFQRPGEVRHMRWDQVELEAKQWRFKATKTRQDHLVPLSTQALSILEELRPLTESSPWVFQSLTRRGRPISNMAMNRALQTMGFSTREEITSHGFRAVARTLLDEKLGFPPAAIEHQLAHRVPDLLGQAYNRTRFLDQRRVMMQAWADYLDRLREGARAEVLPLRRQA